MLHRVYLWWTEVPLMAEALVEERHLLKSLRWWDGFVIALCNPGFLIASLGFSMGALGTWGAVALVIFLRVPYLAGAWHSSIVRWAIAGGFGGFELAMVYLFLFGWSSYAAEVCATFAPEYHYTRRDTTMAMRSAAVFTLLMFLL